MHLWLLTSAVNVLDLSTEGANALFFMIDGQDVVLFGILIMETSDKRLWYGSTNVSQYKSFISTISLHFILHIRCNLFNDSDFLFAMLATVQKHRKLPIVVSTTINYYGKVLLLLFHTNTWLLVNLLITFTIFCRRSYSMKR